MKRQLNLICSIIALLCFVSMYIPIIAPKYAVADYFATGNYTREYLLAGDYFWAREFWTITRFCFSSHSELMRIAISLTQAMLIYWAFYSVRGDMAGSTGIIVSAVNLGVSGFVLIRMLMVMGACRWGVIAVVVLDNVAAVALAVLNALLPGDGKPKGKR